MIFVSGRCNRGGLIEALNLEDTATADDHVSTILDESGRLVATEGDGVCNKGAAFDGQLAGSRCNCAAEIGAANTDEEGAPGIPDVGDIIRIRSAGRKGVVRGIEDHANGGNAGGGSDDASIGLCDACTAGPGCIG